MGGVSMYLAVDTVVFVWIFVLEGALFGGVGAAACVTDVAYFFAVGGDVTSIDGMAFKTAAGFREKFTCNASFALDVEAVVDGLVRVVSCAEG
jgi:hypothetical protein